MLKCKPLSTSIKPNNKSRVGEREDLEDKQMYLQQVGSLIYLILTQPNLVFAFLVTNRYMQIPKKPDFEVI